MAAPTNLVELAEQRLTDWTNEKSLAEAALLAAQTALTVGANALKAATEQYTAQNNAINLLRVELALIATPADAAPLLAELETAIIAQRSATASMLDNEAALTQARIDSDAAREQLRVAEAGIAEQTAALAAEQAAKTKRDITKAAVTVPPLSTLAVRATALLASATMTAARTRIETDFPQVLRDRARERSASVADRNARVAQDATDISALIADKYVADGNPADQVAALQNAMDVADAALREYVSRASARYDAAESTLLRIGSADYPPLTTEEHNAIDAASLAAARSAAAAAESSRDAALELYEEAQAAYDIEYLKVWAADGAEGVTTALADATSDLAQLKEDVDTTEAAWEAKATAFTEAMRATLDAWEAAVPDTAWRDLYDFDAAEATLTELHQDPTALVTALNTAETSLVTALLAADDHEQVLFAYSQALSARSAAANTGGALFDRVRLSALRGDA